MGKKREEEPEKVSRLTDKIVAELKNFREEADPYLEPSGTIEIEVKISGGIEPLSWESFLRFFSGSFEIFEGKKFDGYANNGEPLKFLKTVYFYLLGDPKFLKSPLICVGKQFPEPDLKKGLFIVGGYGCGKTSIMKTLFKIFDRSVEDPPIAIQNVSGNYELLKRYGMRFNYFTAHDVKQFFETCAPEDENTFWNNHKSGRNYYDDITAEAVVSKFGKNDIFKQILENRYKSKAITMVSLNYNEADPTVESTLNMFGNRYGARVYDRLFETFNVIALTGKSLRK